MAKDAQSMTSKNTEGSQGLHFDRYFTPAESLAYELVEWERRDAVIGGSGGREVFRQDHVEFPAGWSQVAVNVVAQKYFYGPRENRESSLRQLVDRVVNTIRRWGVEGGYFASEQDADNWAEELRYLLITQHAAFNSPVWFNIGVSERAQQASACFINSVQDSMESILELVKTEGMLFKYGSGTGTNLSVLRGSKERLSGGGTASGPVSFMRGYDSFAGSIKSGGTTRRAAKMVILNADHPDIVEFVNCKAEEEKKAWALIEAGYDAGFNVQGGAYDSVQFQNANHSVRVPDELMEAVEKDGEWATTARKDGRVIETMRARDLWMQIAEAAWICGDPGLQFDTTIQDWNCVPNTGRINATNPCSEFVFVDDTACNLASLNLRKFQDPDGSFNVERFRQAVRIVFTAQEILVSNASYPTAAIARNSEALRPLGLGYANLGALLMSLGHAYDSEEGRKVAGAVTAIMTGEAYAQSARMAAVKGPFQEFAINREAMLRVMNKHRDHAYALKASGDATTLIDAARETWDQAVELGIKHGYRNAQATVLAPTGTIGLMMDCDTTGIEPDLALVKVKKLVGGGEFVIVNQTVKEALGRLGYDDTQATEIVAFVESKGTIEGAPYVKDEHLEVFDCAFKPVNGVRSIGAMGHVRMMAAVQPFISGSQSKTVNLPHEATVEDIANVYVESWKLGLKCIAIYRDGCKRSQPLSSKSDKPEQPAARERVVEKIVEKVVEVERPVRRRLAAERPALTHKFEVAGHEGYITVGLYDDGQPGEIFITMSKEGSTISGLMDAFATQTSLALQYGVPLRVMVSKFSHLRFEPAGMTSNPEVRIAKSLIDYIFRWLASRFLPAEEAEAVGVHLSEERKLPLLAIMGPAGPEVTVAPAQPEAIAKTEAAPTRPQRFFVNNTDAPFCDNCGAQMVRKGACYSCECGNTTGCG